MKFFALKDTLIFALFVILAGCGGGQSSENTPPPNDFPPGDTGRISDGESNDCSYIVFDIDEMAKAGVKLPAIINGHRVESNSAYRTCSQSIEINGRRSVTSRRGYRTLLVTPPLGAAELFQEDNDLLAKKINVIFDSISLTENAKREIFKKLGIEINDFTLASLQEGLNDYQYATYWILDEGNPLMEESSVPHYDEEGRTDKTILRFGSSADSSLVQRVKDGKVRIVSFAEKFFHTERNMCSFPLRLDSVVNYCEETIASNLAGGVYLNNAPDSATKNLVLRKSLRWLGSGLLVKKDFQTRGSGLALMLRDARDAWKVTPRQVNEWSINFFKLLRELDELNQDQKFYAEWMKKFSSALRMSEAGALEKAIEWKEGSKGLTSAQKDFVLSLAVKLKKLRVSEAWETAVEKAGELSYDSGRLASLDELHRWMSSYRGPNFRGQMAVEESIRLLANPKYSSKFLAQLKEVFAWYKSYQGPNFSNSAEAYKRSLEVVDQRIANASDLELMKTTFRWLKSYQGPHMTSKAEAEKNAFALMLLDDWSSERLQLGIDSFRWLKSYNGPHETNKKVAFSKTKVYLEERDYSSRGLKLLEDSFRWLQSYSGPSIRSKPDALAKSEAYVFENNMTEAQLKELKKIFSKNKREMGSTKALKYAEEQVFGSSTT